MLGISVCSEGSPSETALIPPPVRDLCHHTPDDFLQLATHLNIFFVLIGSRQAQKRQYLAYVMSPAMGNGLYPADCPMSFATTPPDDLQLATQFERLLCSVVVSSRQAHKRQYPAYVMI